MRIEPSARCPLCEARALEPTRRGLIYPSGGARSFELACAFCGLLLVGGADGSFVRRDLLARLAGPEFTGGKDRPYGLDIYTLRSAATATGRGVEPADEKQANALRAPHSDLAASAGLFDLGGNTVPVSLGIMCRAGELPCVLALLPPHASWAAEIVILVDEDAPAASRSVEVEGFAKDRVRLAVRPLAQDFAGQRNALQALSRHDWMLQLDADETLTPGTGARLGAVAAMAERHGVRSIGLPRRNLVDGVLSDLYPDTQYRLNHRTVAYAGRVHERPDRPWQQSMIALHGAILHHLDRRHVETRSDRYEAMKPGGGRLEEEARLLAPYRD